MIDLSPHRLNAPSMGILVSDAETQAKGQKNEGGHSRDPIEKKQRCSFRLSPAYPKRRFSMSTVLCMLGMSLISSSPR